jgi:hypothetical protein
MPIVYIHRRNDVKDTFKNVFYVGIGKNTQRAYHKRKNDRSDFWRKIVAKSGYTVQITHTDLCWEEACAIEKYLICFYGRRDIDLGNLCNLTDGGDGSVGHINSKSSNIKKSITIKNLYKNDDFRRNQRQNTLIAMKTPIARKNKSIAMKKVYENIEYKNKIDKHLNYLINNEELLEKRNNSIKKAWDEKNKLNITLAIKKCENTKCDKDFEQKRSFQKYCCYNCGGSVSKQKKRAMAKKMDNLTQYNLL